MGSLIKKQLYAVEFALPGRDDVGDMVLTKIIEAVSEQDAALDIMEKYRKPRILSVELWKE